MSTGMLSLYHGDTKVGEGRIRTQPGKFMLAGEGLCIGRDSGAGRHRRLSRHCAVAVHRRDDQAGRRRRQRRTVRRPRTRSRRHDDARVDGVSWRVRRDCPSWRDTRREAVDPRFHRGGDRSRRRRRSSRRSTASPCSTTTARSRPRMPYTQLAFALDRAAAARKADDARRVAGRRPRGGARTGQAHARLDHDRRVRRRGAGPGSRRRDTRGSGAPTRSMVYQPMLELLGLLGRNGFACWIFSGGGADFMRAWAPDVFGMPPHRDHSAAPARRDVPSRRRRDPNCSRAPTSQVLDDGPQKPISIHQARRAATDPGRREHRR